MLDARPRKSETHCFYMCGRRANYSTILCLPPVLCPPDKLVLMYVRCVLYPPEKLVLISAVLFACKMRCYVSPSCSLFARQNLPNICLPVLCQPDKPVLIPEILLSVPQDKFVRMLVVLFVLMSVALFSVRQAPPNVCVLFSVRQTSSS